MRLAADAGPAVEAPRDRAAARLMRDLGVKGVHIAERDTQSGRDAEPMGTVVNTWSVEGLQPESFQPAELGSGHPRALVPAQQATRHAAGCKAAIYLDTPGILTKVHAWTPGAGPHYGFLVARNEAISIADYYTIGEGDADRRLPLYAYHPCDGPVLSLHEALGTGRVQGGLEDPRRERDPLGGRRPGVLLYGHARNALWYGSRLSIPETALAPFRDATGLQVTGAVDSGMACRALSTRTRRRASRPTRWTMPSAWRRCAPIWDASRRVPIGRRGSRPAGRSSPRRSMISARGSCRTYWQPRGDFVCARPCGGAWWDPKARGRRHALDRPGFLLVLGLAGCYGGDRAAGRTPVPVSMRNSCPARRSCTRARHAGVGRPRLFVPAGEGWNELDGVHAGHRRPISGANVVTPVRLTVSGSTDAPPLRADCVSGSLGTDVVAPLSAGRPTPVRAARAASGGKGWWWGSGAPADACPTFAVSMR